MKQISLLVTSYSDRDPSQLHRKKLADALAPSNTREARRIYRELRQPSISFLEEQFADMKSKLTIEPAIGMFCGELEPSTMMGIEFKDEVEWLDKMGVVKNRLVDFGEHFSQLNVHLVDLYATRPAGMEYGQSLPGSDVTYQKKLWIALQGLRSNAFENYSNLKKIADEARLANLTLHDSATSLLVYSVLDGDPEERIQFDCACGRLKEILRNRGMIYRVRDDHDVALTNYGAEGWDGFRQTHTYSEVKMLHSKSARV